MVKCSVSGCPNRAESVNHRGIYRPAKRFFSFPKDPTRVKVWLAALRETDQHDASEQHVICEDHFLPDDITADGVSSDAIPIMPPYLDGSLDVSSSWGAESSEEEDGGDDTAPPLPPPPLPPPVQPPAGESWQQRSDGGLEDQSEVEIIRVNLQSQIPCRADMALGKLTRRFLELLVAAPDGSLDLRQVAVSLQTRKRRLYDITSVLGGISLIRKESPNHVKWIGRNPISSFLRRNQLKFQRELENLKLVEDTLDGLIKSCAQQLFDMTDDTENTASAYVTHEDIRGLRIFQEQTVIVVKAPEETALEVPAPKEDSIQIHLKGGRGPISVMTSEIRRPEDSVTSDPAEKSGVFVTLEESRIRTSTLRTES